MGHSIRDLELYMRVVLAADPVLREPKYVSLPTRLYRASLTLHLSLFPYRWPSSETASPAKHLRIGYFLDDGVVTPTPPIIRGLQAALSAFREMEGVELVEFTPIEPEESWSVAVSPTLRRSTSRVAHSPCTVVPILL